MEISKESGIFAIFNRKRRSYETNGNNRTNQKYYPPGYPHCQDYIICSQARDEASGDSDIDLLILLDGEKMTLKDEETITLPLYELELKTGVSISPMVMLKKLWENRPFKTPFYINVINEGIEL